MEEVELLCDRVAIVDQGKIIADDTIKNLISMLGGGVIELGLESLDEETLSGIRALPAVDDVSLIEAIAPPPAEEPPAEERPLEAITPGAGPMLKIQCTRSQDALVQVFGYLNERDMPFTSLRILEPNLESVFLHLTGKRLRD
jgi:ABC-2 type transport system ATP-binding protein